MLISRLAAGQPLTRLAKKCSTVVTIAALLASAFNLYQPALAQTTRPNVAIFEIDPATHTNLRISIHAPASVASTFTVPSGRYVTPNGRYAMAMPALGAYSVMDLQTGTQVAGWPSSAGHNIPYSMVVSPTATYAAVASSSTVDNSWQVVVFNLHDNTQFAFGDHIDPTSGRGSSPYLTLAPLLEGWTGDETSLIVSTGIPNTDASAHLFFKVPMSAMVFGPPALQALVPATTALTAIQGTDKLYFSPDSRLAVFASADSTNLPVNYTPAFDGPSPLPPNTLTMLDLTSNAIHVIARAGHGQGLSAPAWLADDSQVFFAGGNYGGSYFVSNPQLYAYTMATDAVTTAGGVLTTDTHHGISELSVCGNTVFMRTVSTAIDGTPNIGAILSAPFSSLLSQTPILTAQENALGPCVPAIGSGASTGPITAVPLITPVIIIATPAPPTVPPVLACLLPPGLIIGHQAIVTAGTANNLRAAPLVGSAKIGQIPPSGVFTVLSGPICDTTTGYSFWQVNYSGIVGYTAEGKDGVYFVMPYTALPPTAIVISPPTATNTLPPAVVMAPTDCIGYNPHNLTVVNIGATGFTLHDGGSSLILLDNATDAANAKSEFQLYTQLCFIGRNNSRANRANYIMTYLQGPSGMSSPAFAEDCIPYSPAGLHLIANADGSVTLASAGSLMQTLDNNADGTLALSVAHAHSNQCFIGRNNSRSNRISYIFEYWK